MALQREVDVLNSRFLAQEIVDSYIFDTEDVATGSNSIKFFESLTGKDDFEANFEGDKAVVKEGRLFEIRFFLAQVVQDQAVLADHVRLEYEAFHDQGSWEWTVANVLFDRDTLRRIAGGIQFRPIIIDQAAAANVSSAFPGDGRHDNVRSYAIPKVVPGGREVRLTVQWQATGGSPNSTTYSLQMIYYGVEMVPIREVA